MMTATLTEEFEIELTGSYQPAEPDVGVGEGVEDLDISAIMFTRMVTRWVGSEATRIKESFDILAGLDRAAKQAVIQNVLEALGDDAVQTTMLSVCEE